jgi:diguanylate cyclase
MVPVATPPRKMSMSGRLKLAQWTLFGTAGCLAVALTFNVWLFWDTSPRAFARGILSATLLPILLAGPLFFYLTLKLRELAIANHRLAHVASVDALTGCLNRGAFTNAVESWFEAARLAGARPSGALLILDADRFKTINDRFGHDAGDQALKAIARAIDGCVRQDDIVGRLGGEEFGILLPSASAEDAGSIAARIGLAVGDAASAVAEGRYRLTVSTGCAVFSGPMAYRDLFRIADGKLYEAKRSGRNRVVLENVPGIVPEATTAA